MSLSQHPLFPAVPVLVLLFVVDVVLVLVLVS
jgi:hypothetical protein